MSGCSPSTFAAEPYDYGEARRLADELELAEPVAIALVRRGHRTPDAARAFLAADVEHDPSAFAEIGDAVAAITAAIGRCERITIHGDYDVDGICATAILIGALRRAGAECDWLIPDRLGEGYGLSERSVAEVKRRGSGLVITADCGVASVAEVDALLAAGVEVVVTDHHQPGEALPACPIVHPKVSGYPFEGLCGAAVAHKLVLALERQLGLEGPPARDLDLVALATIADLVPLIDESRTLARRGIAELRRARRPGARALMEVAAVEPERVDEGDIGFRLAPRLNAAGRLYRADAGVELMLTDDASRARQIAAELDAANHERRETERGVSNEAEAARRELPEELREASGLVVAGEGWHPGVVGIVASRLVERHGRPAIVLSIDERGRAKGSGRSVPGFDLLAALDACAEHLDRYGGHRAAAGLELSADSIDAFRAAFAAHARDVTPEEGLAASEIVDAVVGPEGFGLDVAEQLERLAPFGQGNPPVRLLVPAARISDVRPMGEEGRHARFTVGSGAGALSARGVAFNSASTVDAAGRSPHDLAFRLEVNHWNGSVEPRAVLSGSRRREEPESDHECVAGTVPDWWWERYEAELARDLAAPLGSWADAGRRAVVDARRGSVVARVAELTSGGARVMAIAADAGRRAGLAAAVQATALGGRAATACIRCPPATLLARSRDEEARFVLTDWAALAACPTAALPFAHLVVIDPPPVPELDRLALAASGEGYLHQAWGSARELAELCWGAEWNLRGPLAEIYRAVAPRELGGEELGAALRGPGRFGRTPEAAARCVRVLVEIGVAGEARDGAARRMGVVSSERTELERSRAWRAFAETHQEGLRYLERRRRERPAA